MHSATIKRITMHINGRFMYYWTAPYRTNNNSVYFLPNGPATLTGQKGLKGCVTKTMALIHNGRLYLWTMSAGFSGKPHGSARMRCFTLRSEIHVYM
jgi:hypothetical protein